MFSKTVICLGALLVATGCGAAIAADVAQMQQDNYRSALGGPTHPVTTPAQWLELDDRARGLAESDGGKLISPPVHLTSGDMVQQGNKRCVAGSPQMQMVLCVEKELQLQAKTCYRVAAAWSYANQAQVSVGFQPGPDGKLASDSFAARGFKLDAPGGSGAFCTDRAGPAILSVSAISAQGTMATNELLEYAVAISGRGESAQDSVARKQADAGKAQAIQAQMDANVAAAKERERRNLELRCRECRENYRACQVQNAYDRQHPRPGVTFSTTCESQYTLCSYNNSHFDAQRGLAKGEKPCGDPPP